VEAVLQDQARHTHGSRAPDYAVVVGGMGAVPFAENLCPASVSRFEGRQVSVSAGS
jgi:tetrahydromethanopterin S-methyltransferase subunit A